MLTAEPQQTNEPNVAVDHRFLRQALKWLRSAKEQGAIKELLEDLGAYLVKHFAAEETRDGFFEIVVQKAPQHAHVVDELKLEHQSLLADIERITEQLEAGPEPASESALKEVSAFIGTMENHEHREEGLLQFAYERDIGVGD